MMRDIVCYRRNNMSNQYLRQLLEEIILEYKINTKTINVLDIGCSNLRPYSRFLIYVFKEYEGIDISQEFISDAQNKIKNESNAKVKVGNIEQLAYNDNSIDLIVCNNMLAYTNKKKALKEILRVLKKGGICISLYNNTLEYSLLKIIKKQTKSVLFEIIHSLTVICNTILYQSVGLKFFHTTYNTEKEFNELLNKYNTEIIFIKKQKVFYDPFSITVINFMFKKKWLRYD